MADHLFAEVDNYITEAFGLQDEILLEVEESIRSHGMPEHSVSPVQGQLLSTLVHTCGAKRIIEVGTLGGYSTIWLGRALPDDGTLLSIEIEGEYADVARENVTKARLSAKVQVVTGEALNVLSNLQKQQEPVDLFFMDADKPNYVSYFNWALKMSRKGSLIVADNVIREGKILDLSNQEEKVVGVRNYLEMLSKMTSVESTIIQTMGAKGHDGIAISVVK